tara:strand:+ start:2725 stop:2946 length:222 start_codon:yes stop_codon:yes gene_type:complete
MKEKFIQDCISLFEREDIKNNLKTMINPLVQPIVSILLKEINPYIYLSLVFVFISFLLHLGIFILLIRNNRYY